MSRTRPPALSRRSAWLWDRLLPVLPSEGAHVGGDAEHGHHGAGPQDRRQRRERGHALEAYRLVVAVAAGRGRRCFAGEWPAWKCVHKKIARATMRVASTPPSAFDTTPSKNAARLGRVRFLPSGRSVAGSGADTPSWSAWPYPVAASSASRSSLRGRDGTSRYKSMVELAGSCGSREDPVETEGSEGRVMSSFR